MRRINLLPCILLIFCMILSSCTPNQTAINNTPVASEEVTELATKKPTAKPTATPTAEPIEEEEPTETPVPTKMPTELTVEMFNEHDYNAVRTFLDITDKDGVSNGQKLSPNHNYNPDEPGTWGEYSVYTIYAGHDELECVIGCINFEWTIDGRLRNIDLCRSDYGQRSDLVGKLDLSGCTCLANVEIRGLNITELNVTGCYSPVVRVYDCPNLEKIESGDDTLMELDVRRCPKVKELRWISPDGFALDYSYHWIDEQNYTERAVITLKADGKGSVGFDIGEANEKDDTHNCPIFGYTIMATPEEGHKFLGWYDQDGNLISKEAERLIFNYSYEVVDGKEVLEYSLLEVIGSNVFTLTAKFK